MKITKVTQKPTLTLGRQGEHLARRMEFDLSDWIECYGDGTAELIYQRPGDKQPYPVAAVREGNTLVWTVSNTDTAVASSRSGPGHCELRWYVGDALVKSQTWDTCVSQTMDMPMETEPPAPEQGWADQAVAAGAAAKASANAARTDAERTEKLAAEAAAAAAQTSRNAEASTQAKEAAQTARSHAEAAQRSAEAACKKAESAAVRQPYPNSDTGTWWVWDPQGEAYRDSGASSSGLPGDPGADGQDGKSAYQAAQDGGYTGTEDQFSADLSAIGKKYEKPVNGIPKADFDSTFRIEFEQKAEKSVSEDQETGFSYLKNGVKYAVRVNKYGVLLGNLQPPTAGMTKFSLNGDTLAFGKPTVSAFYVDANGGAAFKGHVEAESEPTEDSHLTNKAYVDSKLAEKITAPSTASIGQVICVKAVDENGKPTDWEAANPYQLYRHYVEFTSETWDCTGFTAELLLTNDTPIESLSDFIASAGLHRNITVIPHDFLMDINGKWNDTLEHFGAPNGEVQILPFALATTSYTFATVKCHKYIYDYDEQTYILKYKYCGYFDFRINSTYPGDLQITDQVTPV